MAFRLRIRTKNGHLALNHLKPDSTLKELKLLSSQVTDIPVNALKILHGYPPSPLNSVSDSDTLYSLSLRSGDTLIIEEDADALSDNKSTYVDNSSMNGITISSSKLSGILTKRTVPADNSCLFTSVDFVLKNGKTIDLESGKSLRLIIAQIVSSNPNLYNQGFLGKSNPEYCSWISDKKSWGGGIEISILADHFQIEIAVINAQSGRIDRFGEDKEFSRRVFLLYTGVHYDPIVLENFDGTSIVQTKFDVKDEEFLIQALELGAEAKSSQQFTDIESGSMRCLVCSVFIRGELGLKQHLMETGHTNFSEV